MDISERDGHGERITVDDGSETREMTHIECWATLGETGIGHLALRAEPVGVDVMPINYLISHRQLFLRSARGTKVEDIVLHPHVAIQVERLMDGAWHSVVLKGEAVRITDEAEIERSGVRELVPAQSGDKLNYFRIIPDSITGRTFPAR